MIAGAAAVALAIVAVSSVLATLRVWLGPTFPDRLAALDTLAIHVMALSALFAVYSGVEHYLDAVVFLAVLGFVGTTAAAKFFLQGVPIDRDAG